MMNGNKKSASWYGKSTDEEEWTLEIEHDCFSADEDFCVTLYTEQEDEAEGRRDTLVTATPEQARQMAFALLESADHAEQATAQPHRNSS